MRGFMPVCKVHLKEPRKWGKDGKTYTGSTWRKIPNDTQGLESQNDQSMKPSHIKEV
jgi:hypothetical protein